MLSVTADHVRHFAAMSFSLLQLLCTVDNGIFYTAGVNIFLFVNQIMNILLDKYFKTAL